MFVWLSYAMLIVQLLGLGLHHHALQDVDDDCAACQMAGVLPDGIPALSPSLTPAAWIPIYWVEQFVAMPHYLLPTLQLWPFAQAPPQSL